MNILKNKLMAALIAAASLVAFASCDGEKADEGWENIPLDLISSASGKATFYVNDIKSEGSAAVVPQDGKTAKLSMMELIPGYSNLNMTVTLSRDDDTHWSFSGKTRLAEPPSIAATVRSEMFYGIYDLTVSGKISSEGEIEINAATEVTDMASGGLAGSWNIVRKCKIIGGKGPLHLTWKAGNLGLDAVCTLVNTAGAVAVADKLEQITFCQNGNITVRCYESDEDVDFKDLLALRPGIDGDSFTFNASHTEWEETPAANLAFWYAANGLLYVVPNISALNEDESGSSSSDFDPSDILGGLAALAGYGVDLKALNEVLSEIMTKGLAFGYSLENNALSLYLDKGMCDRFVTPLLPLLPLFDQIMEELAKSEDPEVLQKLATIKAVFGLLGIDKPSDLGTLWSNTTEFRVELNFQQA